MYLTALKDLLASSCSSMNKATGRIRSSRRRAAAKNYDTPNVVDITPSGNADSSTMIDFLNGWNAQGPGPLSHNLTILALNIELPTHVLAEVFNLLEYHPWALHLTAALLTTHIQGQCQCCRTLREENVKLKDNKEWLMQENARLKDVLREKASYAWLEASWDLRVEEYLSRQTPKSD